MEKEKLLVEYTGRIVKEELLKDLNNFDFGDVAVYEVEEYYPGYYRGLIHEEKPNFVYILTAEPYSYERIKRVEKTLKEKFDFPFDFTAAKITLFNEELPCIRIKYLDSFEDLKSIIKALMKSPIKLARKGREFKDKSIIKTEKVFLLSQVDDHIYMDQEETENAYLTLNRNMDWRAFEKLSLSIKYNWDGQSFDAAQGIFKRHAGIVDMVRIYTKKNNLSFMQQIFKAYNKK